MVRAASGRGVATDCFSTRWMHDPPDNASNPARQKREGERTREPQAVPHLTRTTPRPIQRGLWSAPLQPNSLTRCDRVDTV